MSRISITEVGIYYAIAPHTLPGLPWDWNFNSHSHSIPTGFLWEFPWGSIWIYTWVKGPQMGPHMGINIDANYINFILSAEKNNSDGNPINLKRRVLLNGHSRDTRPPSLSGPGCGQVPH